MIDSQTTQALGGSASSTPATASTRQLGGNALGKDDFLKLLVTQLRNQDPLNPLDQNQFLAQTAQFSSLEQLQSINQELSNLSAASTGPNLGQAAALLGKTVQVAARDVQLSSSSTPLDFSLDGRATGVQLDILDQQGNTVRTLAAGAFDAGAHSVNWDGRDGNGRLMAPGPYTYRVSATGAADAATTGWVNEGTVTGLKTQGGQVLYQIGASLVRQDDIVNVR